MHCFEELESTNSWLRARERALAPPWTVAWAATQTSGRGRQGRVWASPPGNLYLSIVLPVPLEHQGLLSLSAGVAVAQALCGWGVPARLKWPNDVLVGERKLGGLLIEASSSGGALEQVILGVGVNLAVAPALEDASGQTPTSVQDSLGQTPAVESVGASVLQQVVQWHGRLQHEPLAVRTAWRSLAVDWWGQTVQVSTGTQVWEGRLLDLGHDGSLLVQGQDGRERALTAGDVLRVRRALLN